MNPAAPIPPVRDGPPVPPGAEVGRNHPGIPAPNPPGFGAWRATHPLQTDGSLNTQPQYGALAVSCLNGCLPPTERAAACSGPGGSLVPDDLPSGAGWKVPETPKASVAFGVDEVCG